MPYYDYRDDLPRSNFREEMLEDQVKHRDAMLCAFFRLLDKQGSLIAALNSLDYKKCGIERTAFEKWWKLHQAEDAKKEAAKKAKRLELKQKREKEAARKELIATLTKEQLELLGVK